MVKITTKRAGTAPESFHTNEFFGTVPRLPVPRLPPGGSLGTPKILGTGATLRLGPISLHDQNWECRVLRRIYTTFVLGTALQNSGTRAKRFGHGPLDLHDKICSSFFSVDFSNGTPKTRTALLNL